MNNCDKTSNNKYFDCPARMDDGRHFTDYRQNSFIETMIRESNNLSSNYDYRQFLINNAKDIMSINNNYVNDKLKCNNCNYVEVPFNIECNINKDYSICNNINPVGVGIKNNGIFEQIEEVEKFYSTKHTSPPKSTSSHTKKHS